MTPPAPVSARVSHAPGTLPSPPNRPNSDVDEIPVNRPSPTAPTVPLVAGALDYCCVVLVLRPPHVSSLLDIGRLVPADSSHRPVVNQSQSQGYNEIPHRVPQAGSFEQFVPPSEVEGFSGSRIKTPPVLQHSWEPLCPYPCPQASSALKAENDRLKTEVEEI
ncbi:hypothetical protein F5879DRAFT_994984 [Lentinula edodes]|nr:hypothetical protein F5879DRAFT_994984 [Lentinula edodes]